MWVAAARHHAAAGREHEDAEAPAEGVEDSRPPARRCQRRGRTCLVRGRQARTVRRHGRDLVPPIDQSGRGSSPEGGRAPLRNDDRRPSCPGSRSGHTRGTSRWRTARGSGIRDRGPGACGADSSKPPVRFASRPALPPRARRRQARTARRRALASRLLAQRLTCARDPATPIPSAPPGMAPG